MGGSIEVLQHIEFFIGIGLGSDEDVVLGDDRVVFVHGGDAKCSQFCLGGHCELEVSAE